MANTKKHINQWSESEARIKELALAAKNAELPITTSKQNKVCPPLVSEEDKKRANRLAASLLHEIELAEDITKKKRRTEIRYDGNDSAV